MTNPKAEVSLAVTVDEISFRFECGVRALEAVRIAIESGPYEAKQFVGALFCIEDYLANLQKELAQEVDAALARGRKEAAQCQEQP